MDVHFINFLTYSIILILQRKKSAEVFAYLRTVAYVCLTNITSLSNIINIPYFVIERRFLKI